MPTEDLLERFEVVVQSAQESMVRRYLEEAYRCFTAEAYNGAVVMAWNAVSWYLRQVVEAISIPLFEHNYRILYEQNPPGELWRISDGYFIETCQRMGILGEVADKMGERQRNIRNRCAHPSGYFATADDTVAFVESIREVVSCRVVEERLQDIATVREFIKAANEEDGEIIASWVYDDICGQLSHNLLTMYMRDEDIRNVSGIVGLWQGLWPRIDERQKEGLWDKLEQAVKKVLQDEEGTGFRTPEDLVRLIVWPSPDEVHEARDRIGELFVEWFERLAERGDFRAVDMDLAREVRQHMPPALRERLQATLEKMTRRYTE